MNRFFSYLNSAEKLLAGYAGKEPFPVHARHFFSQEKKFGSRDRKNITHLCYCYFRLGKAGPAMDRKERILAGLFLCSRSSHEILGFIRPEWNERVTEPAATKFKILKEAGHDLELASVFPDLPLSEGINKEDFIASHFIQPDLFIRVRPGFGAAVLSKLSGAGITFREIPPRSIGIANAVPLNDVIELDREAVIQDLSSQRVWDLLPSLDPDAKVWDCCAASGGKSFLVKDKLGDLDLTVSDIRESVLANLRRRFENGGLSRYRVVRKDLTDPEDIPADHYNLVIADVPCTGSGTWSRTPEQLYHFQQKSISHFSGLQEKISGNIIGSIKPGGFLLYITCSVFRQENEDITGFIVSHYHLEKREEVIIPGYGENADTMYACLMQKIKA